MSGKGRMLLGAVASMLAFTQVDHAQAQQVAQQVAQAAGLEEIVVTARRREENVQSVPIAVTVFNGERLRETKVDSINDLSFLVPSLNTTNAVNRNQGNLAIRGVAGAFGSARTTSTSTYLNDVPLDVLGPGAFFDLENVQVLKGPQGTAFGRSAIGGSILLVTKRPTDQFEGHAQVSMGNYHYKEFEVALNVPVIPEKLSVRLAGVHSERRGFTTVLATGEKLDGRDYRVGRGSVLFKPTDTIENLLTYNWRDTDATGTGVTISQVNPRGLGGAFLILYPTLPAILADQLQLGARQIRSITPAYTSDKSRLQVITDTLSWQISDEFTVKNVFGWTLNQTRPFYDHDGTALPVLTFLPPGAPWTNQQRTTSDEVQIHGNHFNNVLDWFAGAYWEYNKPYHENIGGDVPNQLDPGDLKGCIKAVSAQFGALPPSQWTYNYSTSGNAGCTGNRIRSLGLYAQGTVDLSQWLLDGLKLTGGYRHTRDRIEVANEAYQIPPTGIIRCNTLFSDSNCRNVLNANFSAPGFTVGLDWQFAPNRLLYVSSRRAYKPGGINGVDTAGRQLPNYNPETLTEEEIGLKADWVLGGRPLRTNLSFYYGKYSNIQQQTTFFNPVTVVASSLIANAATATAKGGELELQYLPTDQLLLSASYANNNLKFDKFVGFDPVSLQLTDRSAEKFPYLLKNKITGSVRYTVPLGDNLGNLAFSTTWAWQGKLNFTPTPQPGATEPSMWLGNARIDWNEIAGYPIDASFFVTNVSNKLYRTGMYTIYDSFGYSSNIWGEPRMWGFSLRYRFGGEAR
jgi:iron complex outermembrane receptor protein